MKKLFSISLFVVSCASFSFSEVVDIRGIGEAKTVDEKGAALPEGEAGKRAVREAAINGIDKVLNNQSSALRQQFNERARDHEEIEQIIRNIINNAKVEITPRPEEKMTRACLEGSFDLQTLRDTLNRIPKIHEQVERVGEQVAVFFTVRTVDQVTKKEELIESRKEHIKNKEEGNEKLNEDGVQLKEEVEKEQKDQFGREHNNFQEKAKMIADPKFKPMFGTGLLAQLAAKGFEQITDGSFFEISEEMDRDITERDDLRAATWRNLIDEIKKEGDGVAVVIVGSLDFAMPVIDSLSGQQSVEATISAKVYRIVEGQRQPRYVAGLAPKTEKGVGPTQENAKQNAVNAMSVLAANEIITSLKNNKVIK